MIDRRLLLKQFCEIADCIKNNEKEIIEVLCEIETYKTAVNEVNKTIKALRSYDHEDCFLQTREPLGCVAVFLPFNMPLYSLVLYTFGPIYAGNKVLVRPSKLTHSQIERIWGMCGSSVEKLPLVLVQDSGKDFLNSITIKQPVDAIVFTGQWNSVNRIVEGLPERIKLIYCGSGVCPLIIRDDADLLLAVEIAIESRLFNSGQDCLSTERILVHQDLSDRFLKLLVKKVKNIHKGSNQDENSLLGSLISKDLVNRAFDLVKEAKGKVLLDGTKNPDYVDPTVILTTPDQEVFKVEKFAPVFPIAVFPDNDSMVDVVNHSDYILGVTIIGGNYPEGSFVASHVEYNRSVLSYEEDDAHVPFGGYRKSGFVYENHMKKEGPILFSVETSKQINS